MYQYIESPAMIYLRSTNYNSIKHNKREYSTPCSECQSKENKKEPCITSGQGQKQKTANRQTQMNGPKLTLDGTP